MYDYYRYNIIILYRFGGSGLPVGRPVVGGRAVAHGIVVVGVLGERQPVGDVKVRVERVIDVVVQPAAHAIHRVPGPVALAHQVVPQPVSAAAGRPDIRHARRDDDRHYYGDGRPRR